MGLDAVFVHSGFRRQVAAMKVIAKEILLIKVRGNFTGYVVDY